MVKITTATIKGRELPGSNNTKASDPMDIYQGCLHEHKGRKMIDKNIPKQIEANYTEELRS